jgi:hypothetical protein
VQTRDRQRKASYLTARLVEGAEEWSIIASVEWKQTSLGLHLPVDDDDGHSKKPSLTSAHVIGPQPAASAKHSDSGQ